MNPAWLIGIPLLDCEIIPNRFGTIIHELIINQQRFSSHCSVVDGSLKGKGVAWNYNYEYKINQCLEDFMNGSQNLNVAHWSLQLGSIKITQKSHAAHGF